MKIREGIIEIYIDDFKEEIREELLRILGDNNYDVFPIFTMSVPDEENKNNC